MSKAWAYTTTNGDDWVVVFADTKKKAKELVCEVLEECVILDELDETERSLLLDEIEVDRFWEIDYLDKPEGYIMDWGNADDRIALVKVGDWWCLDLDHSCADCIRCPANGVCQSYNEIGECHELQGEWCEGCRHRRENG